MFASLVRFPHVLESDESHERDRCRLIWEGLTQEGFLGHIGEGCVEDWEAVAWLTRRPS